jgi:hypothetical protein
MAGPKAGRNEDRGVRDLQKEVVSGLRGATATRVGEHGHAVSASVMDTIAANYKGKLVGFDRLAAKVASSQRFDPPGIHERMAEAARHSASGTLDFTRSWNRVMEADQRSKHELKVHIVDRYKQGAKDLAKDASKDLLAADGKDVSPEKRLKIGAARAEATLGQMRGDHLKVDKDDPDSEAKVAAAQAQGRATVAALGGDEHVREVLTRLYAGGAAIEATKGTDPFSAKMASEARVGLKGGQEPASPLQEDGELNLAAAQRYAVPAESDPVKAEQQKALWTSTLANLDKVEPPTEAEVRSDNATSLGEPVSPEVQAKLKIGTQLKDDAGQIEKLDMGEVGDRLKLWKHLKEVDPEKAKEHTQEQRDLALFRWKAMWNSESAVRGRVIGSALGHAGKAGMRTLQSLEGMSEQLLHALQTAMEMQDHAARGAVTHLGAAAFRVGSTAVKAPGGLASDVISHTKELGDNSVASARGHRAEAQQSMGLFLARHEMAERMADLAQANAKEGLETSYDYARSFVSAAESRQQATEAHDPSERQRLEAASRQARNEMKVHLERLRVEHPEFHDLFKDHPKLGDKAVDEALERIGDPQVAVSARQAGRAREAGLSGANHGEFSPMVDMGKLPNDRRALGAVQGGWVEVSALGANGRGERLGRIQASDFDALSKAHEDARKQSEHGGHAGPSLQLTLQQAEGWALLDRLQSEGMSTKGVGALSTMSKNLEGHPELLSSRNPWHAEVVKAANDGLREGSDDAQGLVLMPACHAQKELMGVQQAVREVTYKTPMELQAFLERVVTMQVAETEYEMNFAAETAEDEPKLSDPTNPQVPPGTARV